MATFIPTLALWDNNPHRAVALKDRLDMFAPGDKEATLLPLVPEPPLLPHDVVFLSFDECGEPILRVARTVRQSSEMTFILLISNRDSDLSYCFRPKIRPSGVLFRPVQNAQLRDMLDEIADELDRLTQSGSEDVFVFKSEGASYRVAFRDILFFEASNKKILVHTMGQEIGYYDSIDKLAAALPPYFVRCHRSFIVNTRKVETLRGADMEIKLSGGYRVPFSRSNSNAVKQAIANI